MDTVDLKGIAWVGNVYQKFEAMCLEVEEAMYQETAKYVENQVQTVGASVKRFYSDVIHDLGPPSSADHVKVAASDLNQYADVGIHKKPKENMKELTKTLAGVKECSEKENSQMLEKSGLRNEKYHFPTLSISEVSEKDELVRNKIAVVSRLASVEMEAKVCNSSWDADEVSDETSIATATSDAVSLVESGAKKGEELGYISTGDTSSSESTERRGDCQLISQTCLEPTGVMRYRHADDEGFYMSYTGDCNMDIIENDDSCEPMVETPGEARESNLDETCVLVEENVYSDSSNQRKNKSYKIQQAFSLRMKSARKQEYEQLAALYGKSNARSKPESIETAMPTLVINSSSKSLQTCDLPESDWELL